MDEEKAGKLGSAVTSLRDPALGFVPEGRLVQARIEGKKVKSRGQCLFTPSDLKVCTSFPASSTSVKILGKWHLWVDFLSLKRKGRELHKRSSYDPSWS